MFAIQGTTLWNYGNNHRSISKTPISNERIEVVKQFFIDIAHDLEILVDIYINYVRATTAERTPTQPPPTASS